MVWENFRCIYILHLQLTIISIVLKINNKIININIILIVLTINNKITNINIMLIVLIINNKININIILIVSIINNKIININIILIILKINNKIININIILIVLIINNKIININRGVQERDGRDESGRGRVGLDSIKFRDSRRNQVFRKSRDSRKFRERGYRFSNYSTMPYSSPQSM